MTRHYRPRVDLHHWAGSRPCVEEWNQTPTTQGSRARTGTTGQGKGLGRRKDVSQPESPRQMHSRSRRGERRRWSIIIPRVPGGDQWRQLKKRHSNDTSYKADNRGEQGGCEMQDRTLMYRIYSFHKSEENQIRANVKLVSCQRRHV